MLHFFLKIYMVPSNVFNFFLFKLKKVKKGKNLRVNGKIGIYGNGKIIIGNNVTINSMPRFNPIGCGIKTMFQTRRGGSIEIGNNVGISHCAITAYSKIEIKDNVLLGSGSKIYDTDFHSLDYDVRVGNLQGAPKSKNVVIEEGAFIGAMSIVLKGVHVGKHSIIGAGSVVTKDVPDGEIWAGNPAKKIGIIETFV